MNRNIWSPEEREEYEDLCRAAYESSGSTRGRAEEYLRLIRDAEQAHRFYAGDCLSDMLVIGARSHLKSWQNRQRVIPVDYEGTVLVKPRMIGTTYITEDGKAVDTQAIFDYFTREQLEAKAQEYVANIRAYKVDLHVVLSLIELLDRAPEAMTPAQAAEQIGTTVEEWLKGEKVA